MKAWLLVSLGACFVINTTAFASKIFIPMDAEGQANT